MTFNRKMVWLDEDQIPGGGIMAWSKCARLRLSGKDAASDWYLDPQEGNFKALADETGVTFNTSQAVTARLFIHEFLVDQHPDLFFEADAGDRPAVVKVVFERWLDYSPLRPAPLRTLYVSDNISGKGVLRIPLAEILRKRGYKTRYMRINLNLEFGAGTTQQAKFRAWSDSKPALVAELPRTIGAGGDLTLNAVFVDENGDTLHATDGLQITARGEGCDDNLSERGATGIFQAKTGLNKAGDYRFLLKARHDGKEYFSETSIAITDGEFVRHHYDEQGRPAGYIRGGRHLGFMSGSTVLSEAVAALDVGTDKETIVLDAHELMEKTGRPTARTDCVWMTSLNEAELDRWLEHRRKSGYRVFLMANWSPEILNAGGTISPYGAEIAARIFNFCRRHDIYLKADAMHDTFGRSVSFPNLTQYRGAGFLRDYEKLLDLEKSQKTGKPCIDSYPNYRAYLADSWCLPEVRKLTERYLRHFFMLFRDETAIMLLSACGEDDKGLGARLVNPFLNYMRKHDKNHLFLVDLRGDIFQFGFPLMNTENMEYPFAEKHCSIACVAGYGKWKNDAFAGVMLKFFGLNPDVGPAEGDCYAPSWPSYYEKPFHPAEECMRLMVRDFLWLCLVHRFFAAYNWNESFMAEEHQIPAEVSRLIDWKNFKRRIPPVMLRVREVRGEKDIDKLALYDELFSRAGLDYGYIWDKDPLPDSAELFAAPDRSTPPYMVIDAQNDNLPDDFLRSDKLPQSVKQSRIVRLESSCYAANALISKDLDEVVIYLRNGSNYVTRDWFKNNICYWYWVKCQRGGLKKGNFKLELSNLSPAAKNLRVYDLNTRTVVQQEKIAASWSFSQNGTTHDFVIVVYKEVIAKVCPEPTPAFGHPSIGGELKKFKGKRL